VIVGLLLAVGGLAVVVMKIHFREPPAPHFEWDLRLSSAAPPAPLTTEPHAPPPGALGGLSPERGSTIGGQAEISGLVLLDGTLYWSSRADGELRRLSRAGTVEVVSGGLRGCALLGVLSGELCASHREAGGVAVSCVSPSGGRPREVARFVSWAPVLAAAQDALVAADASRLSIHSRGSERQLVEGEPVVHALGVTQDWVYYSVPGAVKRVSRDGGAPDTVRAVANLNVQGMAVNPTHVFWAEQQPEREMWRAAFSGGGAEKVAWLPELALHLAADERFVYAGAFTALFQVAVGGGTPHELARAARATQVAADDRRICWASYDAQQIVCQPLSN
jgi:hypothetical protein